MIKKKELIDYFWMAGNMITSAEGVELAMHGDSMIEVSVMLRNVLDVDLNGLTPMLQLHREFDDFAEFQKVMKIGELEDLHEVTLVQVMVLYAGGKATLYKAQY